MSTQITELRRGLSAAVEPVLAQGELVSVNPAEGEYEAGLNKLRFAVTITVGDPNATETEERLDLLLSGSVRAAIEGAESSPVVIKSSGYQNFPGPDGTRRLGATWTALVQN